ncbi:BCCT family transporter [Rhodococcus triatomae]|uniref:Choline/glycine/proline betaine transport protein n=1 Tax=Rhodococcus triatomae TaxID=300028 RepID=A0A1G8MVG0_9NOCA|nr:choline BCCT transporter BetT [Rhodococcus triatomae]QNG19104.1 BCCT family transporter [Rhodococcus triatomae]QNG24983.1 BCCT family transporter [Rhodococcus triatomae]SDI71922.1 choline/glycine/proline betaine transport protein [Rhodococcus triatomae]
MTDIDDQHSVPPPHDEAVPVRTGINRPVFVVSSLVIVSITAWAMVDREGADTVIGNVVAWISAAFGWWYFLVATAILLFVLFIAVSRYGKIRLGPDHSRPKYNVFTWGAMLFAAGIGIDLMFFSVSEPVTQYLQPPVGPGENTEAARQAVVWTLFHYGITGWAMYALMGASLAYFAYRRGLPLSIRSALYPVIGKRVNGRVGDTVEIAAVIGTIFGIATSLGIGVVQLNFGLHFMFGLPEGTAMQIALIAVAVLMATISVVSGVDRGIRRLSELNVILALGLMLFVLIAGKTRFLLDALVMNVGDYISRFPSMTLDTFAFDAPTEWLNAWTLFFWAWWIAWAPFVGLFLARISRGRTLRQFIAAVLTIPFAFIGIWIAIFGNAALSIVVDGNGDFGETAMTAPESAFYSLLDQYPGVVFSAGIATFTGLLFYVTSADSGALVMAKFTSHPHDPEDDGPAWTRIFWAVATGLLTLAMLLVGGVSTLQNATIIMGLPFSFVMVLIMAGLHRALRSEGLREDSIRATLHSSLSERVTTERGVQRTWRQRVARSLSYPDRDDLARYVDSVARPALQAVVDELCERDVDATLVENIEPDTRVPHIDLTVTMAGNPPFRYQLWPERTPIPSFAMRSSSGDAVYYRLEVYLTEGSQGYDVMGYGRDQLIGDVLDQYERHIEYLRLRNTPTME